MNQFILLSISDFINIENLAVACSIGFVVFNARGKIISWPLGIIGSALYVWIFINAKIYGDSILQLFYVGMGIYGWIEWSKAKKIKTDLPIVSVTLSFIIKIILIGAILIPIAGYLLERFTDSDIPYWDAYTTVFSFIATYMMAKRIMENWLLWIIIDLSCVFIYAYKDLNSTVVLFIIYTLMAVYGYFNWRNLKIKQLVNA